MDNRTDSRHGGTSYWHGCWMDSVRDRSRAPRSFVDWIAHRLPKQEDLDIWGEVLVTTDEGNIHVAIWTGNEYEIKGLGWCESGKVIAWARMPEPYKKEG